MTNEEFAGMIIGRFIMLEGDKFTFDEFKAELLRSLASAVPAGPLTGDKLLQIALKHDKPVAGYQFADKFDFDAIAKELNAQFFSPSPATPRKIDIKDFDAWQDRGHHVTADTETYQIVRAIAVDFANSLFPFPATEGQPPQNIMHRAFDFRPFREAAHRIDEVLDVASLDDIRIRLRNLSGELKQHEPIAPAAVPAPESVAPPQNQVDPTVNSSVNWGLSNLPSDQMNAHSVTIAGFPVVPIVAAAPPMAETKVEEVAEEIYGSLVLTFEQYGEGYKDLPRETWVEKCAAILRPCLQVIQPPHWAKIALQHITSKEWDDEFIEQQEFESYLGWLIQKLKEYCAVAPVSGNARWDGKENWLPQSKEQLEVRNLLRDVACDRITIAGACGKLMPVSGNGTEPPDAETEFRAWMATHSTTDYIGGELRQRAAIEFAEYYAKLAGAASHNGQGWEGPNHAMDVVVARIAREHGFKLPDASLIEFGAAVYKEAVRHEKVE